MVSSPHASVGGVLRMICELCHGQRHDIVVHGVHHVLCPQCNGQGVAYCCDDAGVNPPNSYPTRETLMASERATWAQRLRVAIPDGVPPWEGWEPLRRRRGRQ